MRQTIEVQEPDEGYINPFNLKAGQYGVTKSGHVWVRTLYAVVNLSVIGNSHSEASGTLRPESFSSHEYVRPLKKGSRIVITVDS